MKGKKQQNKTSSINLIKTDDFRIKSNIEIKVSYRILICTKTKEIKIVILERQNSIYSLLLNAATLEIIV